MSSLEHRHCWNNPHDSNAVAAEDNEKGDDCLQAIFELDRFQSRFSEHTLARFAVKERYGRESALPKMRKVETSGMFHCGVRWKEMKVARSHKPFS
jgi:hypothetical protein